MGIFDLSLDAIKELEENKDIKSLTNQLDINYKSNRVQIAEALGNIGNPKARINKDINCVKESLLCTYRNKEMSITVIKQIEKSFRNL